MKRPQLDPFIQKALRKCIARGPDQIAWNVKTPLEKLPAKEAFPTLEFDVILVGRDGWTLGTDRASARELAAMQPLLWVGELDPRTKLFTSYQ